MPNAEVFCSVCGLVVAESDAVSAAFNYLEAERAGAPPYKKSIRVQACKRCIEDINAVTKHLFDKKGLGGFHAETLGCLRRAWVDRVDPVPRAIEAMESYLDDIDREN